MDLNGERRVDVSGDDQSAVLYNLSDSTVDPVFLAAGASGTTLAYQPSTDDSGNTVSSLLSIALTITDDEGNQNTLTFDRDGNSLDTPSSQSTTRVVRPMPASVPSAPSAVQTLQQKMQGSETFRALKAGFGW